MSLLYLGLHPDTKQPLAIKVLSQAFITHPEIVERFLKESQIIALTAHPNIVKLYGQGEWEGGLYIAMELIRGISLRQFILQHSLSLKRSIDIILQVAYALLHLHTHGVIHRDLKPENILITEDGEIKVIDFGIAALHGETEINKARVLGTPHYMSPEQKENPLKVSFSSDIYSLGIITFELILGKLSYGMINLNLLPRGLRKIAGKALATSSQERYQDIVDFITDLSQYLKSGAWEKDRPGTDQVKELLETIQKVSQNLSPSSAPKWPDVEIGIAKYKTLSQLGLYYDFFKCANNTYGVFLSMTSSNGPDGAIYSAQLRGMVGSFFQEKGHSLTEKITPGKFLSFLRGAQLDQQFAFYFLLLEPLQDQLSFISCGMGSLFHLSPGNRTPRKLTASNPVLGSPFTDEVSITSDNWNIGDTLILHTLNPQFGSFQEEPPLLSTAISENAHLSAAPQAEAILKQMALSPIPHKYPRALITLQRID